MGYWKDIWLHTKTIVAGLGITARYMLKPAEITTVQYPHEMDDIPERHRGIHYLETDVCILCYQCSRACPVDCIEIEGTRVANDGFEGAYKGAKGATITKFTVDYARCIFCNLCIEPCPVDCIHMGKEFDFSGYTRAEMVKNLLTDQIFSRADQLLLNKARKTVIELEEKDKREKEEKKKQAAAAAAAAKAAAGAKPAPGKAEGAAPSAGGAPPAGAKPAEGAATPAADADAKAKARAEAIAAAKAKAEAAKQAAAGAAEKKAAASPPKEGEPSGPGTGAAAGEKPEGKA
jgi:formate hydrogenlyase subunit 6/NADH:ubiquinone oxidoreductase subunit I